MNYFQAAATTCYVATHPRLANVTGKYFADCNEAPTSKLGSNLAEAARIWSASEIMVSKESVCWPSFLRGQVFLLLANLGIYIYIYIYIKIGNDKEIKANICMYILFSILLAYICIYIYKKG